MTQPSNDGAARLLERLLTDPKLRARFRNDPAAVAREAGLDDLGGELMNGSAMQTLEARESRSSLAGVMMAAAVEGIAGFGLVDQAAAHERDPSAAVNGLLAGDEVARAPAPADGPDAAELATPEGAAAANAVPGEWSSHAVEHHQVAKPEELVRSPERRPVAHVAAVAPDPTKYGVAGTGGEPTPEALALVHNPHVSFLDSAGTKDLRSGRVDPRIVDILTRLAGKHRISISALASDHSTNTSGGSVSNHYYGRGVDIAVVDGQAVSPSHAGARRIAESLMRLPRSIRPTEVGSPWALPLPGYFTNAEHQNHLHIAFDDAITKGWKTPGDAAASSADAGVYPVVDADEAASAQDPLDGSDTPPDVDDSDDEDSGDVREDGGSGDTEAEADDDDDEGGDDEEDGEDEDEDEDDEGSGDVADGDDAADEATHDPDSDSDSDADQAPGSATPDDPGAVPDEAVPLDETGDAIDSYPGDDAPRADIAAWMAGVAHRNGLPPELPVMASLVESGMTNINGGDRDSVGFYQMRVGIWNNGKYAGYPDRPELQLKWFIDKALEVKAQRRARGQSVDNPSQYGEWIADVERPAAQYRGRYQLRLDEARALVAHVATGHLAPKPADAQDNGVQFLPVVDPDDEDEP
jgi:hypothetical protein